MDADSVAVVGAIAAAIAAAASIYSAYGSWLDRREKRRLAERETAKQWSLTLNQLTRPGLVGFVLERRFDSSPMVHLRTLTVLRPKGAALLKDGPVKPDPTTGAVEHLPPSGAPMPTLTLDRDANEIMGITHFKDGTGLGQFAFWVQMPPRPWWSRSDSAAVRISVKIEEISARRPRSEIIVTSQEIAWMAKKTAIAA